MTPRVAPIDATERPAPAGPRPAPATTSFAGVLSSREPQVQFSGHARQRLERRGIPVGPETLARLGDGVARAAGKGARDSVVLVDGTAFVVAVRSRTVITAVDQRSMRDHVFTNIDSAVIA